MRFYSGMTVAMCATALVACGGDDGDEEMSPTTGGVGLSTGASAAPGTTAQTPASTGSAASGTAANTGSITGGTTAATGAPSMDAGIVAVSPAIATKMEAFAAQWNSHAQVKCECYELFGFTSEQECLGGEPVIDADAAECAKRMFSQDPAAANLFFDCATPAAEAHTKCLEQTFLCDRPYAFEAFQSCSSPYTFANAGCLENAESVEDPLLSTCGLFQ